MKERFPLTEKLLEKSSPSTLIHTKKSTIRKKHEKNTSTIRTKNSNVDNIHDKITDTNKPYEYPYHRK